VQIQALWGIWAARRSRNDYRAALDVAHRYAEAAAKAGNVGATHLGDRMLAITHHLMGGLAAARIFAERALGQSDHFDPASGIGFQVETPAAIGTVLARILWLSGLPDQAKAAAIEAVAAAEDGGNSSFSLCYVIGQGALPVALWTGDLAGAQRLLDMFIVHGSGNPRLEQRAQAFARMLALSAGDDTARLFASFAESAEDPMHTPPIPDLDRNGAIAVPLPREEPIDAIWNTAEVLRIDAELVLWHAAPGAAAAAEAKLVRAVEIARDQLALSWELRAAMSLARLWRQQGRSGAARELMGGTYRKFAEGFDTRDLVRAANMIAELQSDNFAV
jgi:hypothetical protein